MKKQQKKPQDIHLLKTALFKEYIKAIYGNYGHFQFDHKIIFYKADWSLNNDHKYDIDRWIFYYDFRDKCIYFENKTFSMEQFVEKLQKMKAFI